MDTVARIKKLLEDAKHGDVTISEINWEAAKLIHEWLAEDESRTQAQLAKEVGCSQQHISVMRKCWQVCVVDTGLKVGSFRDLGSFYNAYNSPQVRGDSARENPRHKGRYEDQEGGSIHDRIACAANDIDFFMRNPDRNTITTDEDREALRHAYDQLRRYWRESKG